jgi:hypothetical protein
VEFRGGYANAAPWPFSRGCYESRSSCLSAEAVQEEIAEFGERVSGGQSGAVEEEPGLECVYGDGDDVGGEGAVEVAEVACLDAFVDEFVDSAGGGVGVAAVEPGGRNPAGILQWGPG